MKIGTPKTKDIFTVLAIGAGITIGAMVGDGAYAVLPGNNSMLKRGGLAAAGFTVPAVIKSNDNLSSFVKGLGLGIGGSNTVAGFREVTAPKVVTTEGMNSAFLRAAMGMNSQIETFAFPQITQASPAYQFQQATTATDNPFDGMRVAS